MFEIYKSRKWTYVIPIGLFWGAVPILGYVIINDYLKNGFSSTIIMGTICTSMVTFFGFVFLAMFRADPYKNIRELQSEDPVLVEKMEADFSQSTYLCPHIWKGQYFYFFEGSMNFLVVPIGEIQEFSMKKGFSRSIGVHYDCQVVSPYGKAEFAVAIINQGAENLHSVAEEIAKESLV